MMRRPWTVQRLHTDPRGRVSRITVDHSTAELSAELELMRAALAEAIALLHSRQPVERATRLLADIGIPAAYTKENP